MKILVVGDFHGKFPKKFEGLIKKEKIEVLLSNGDYLPFHYRKLWFKHCFGKDIELWEIIGKKKYKELILKNLKDAENCLKKLNKLPIPVFTVLGNVDYPAADDVMDMKKVSNKKAWKWDDCMRFANIMKKYNNITRIDYKFANFGDFIFIGARGHTFPGRVKSKAFKKHKKVLDSLFKKFREENKEGRVIFVSHNVPYNTKLDKIGKKAHKLVRGKHFGSKIVRRVINSHQPILHVGGHIHEGKGMQNIRKTLCINPGAIHEGQGAIVEITEDKKIKVKFIN